jgi:hypothetical protein
MAVPGERAVGFVRRREPNVFTGQVARWVNYPEMVRDRCETGFWGAEWLRVVRGLRVEVVGDGGD